MGNTQYGNGHVTGQVERSMNNAQQKVLKNGICILQCISNNISH
jgi:hypothetical protein